MPPKRDPALLAKLRERQRQARGVRTSKHAQEARRNKKFKNADVENSVDLASQLMSATGHNVGSQQRKQLEHIIKMAAEYGPEAALQKMGVKDKTMIEKIMRGMDEFSNDVKQKTEEMAAKDEEVQRRTPIQPPEKQEVQRRTPIQPPQKRKGTEPLSENLAE